MTMMSAKLEDVLDRLLAEHGSPTPAAVAAVSAVHPEHRAAILEFAAAWAEESHLPRPVASAETEAGKAVLAQAQASFAKALDIRLEGGEPARGMSLAELAASVGRNLKDVAAAARVDLAVILKLDAGRIVPASIGTVLPRRIADFLGIDPGLLSASWSRMSPAAASAFLPSVVAPVSPDETLAEALAASNTDPAEIEELLEK